MSGAYLITDSLGAGELKQHQCSGSGMANLFNLLQRMKGNIGQYSLLYKLFLQISPTGN